MAKLSLLHSFIRFIFALAFPFSVSYFAYPKPVFRYMAIAFGIYLITVAIYSYWQLKTAGNVSKLWPIIGLMLFFISWAGLFLLPPTYFLQYSVLALLVPLSYFMQRTLTNVGENILFNRVIFTSAAFFVTLTAGSTLYFSMPDVLYLAIVFIFSSSLARSAYELTPLDSQAKLISSLVIGMFSTEWFWVLSFLPFHYSVLGLLAFYGFYLLWYLNYSYLFHSLSNKKLIFSTLLALGCIGLVLLFTPWRVVT